MKRTVFLPPILMLTACTNPEALFSGPVRPIAGTCDPPTTAALTLRHRAVAFAPSTGTLVLKGIERPSGHITASLTSAGIDHKPYTLMLEADHQADAISGTYTTPRCRYRIALKQTAQ